MSAYDFVARALASQAAASSGLTFRELGRTTLPVSRIDSSGYASAGHGRGTYVADDLATPALMRAHPLAVFLGAGDRHFRLAGDERGFVTPEQFGCPVYASGINQQPFIQAAVAYADAAGLNGVLFAQPRYELWAPVRPNGLGFDGAGSYIALRRSIALVGTGPGRVVLDCRNSQGGRNDTLTQTVAIPDWPEDGKRESAWIGHGIYVDPAVPPIDNLRIENIEVDCTVTYDPHNRGNANTSNCGLLLGDNVRSVLLRDVTIRNCAGTLYSFGGRTGAKEELLENCVFEGSPEGALRCGLATRGTYTNLRAGNAYRSQIFGGHGHAFLGGILHDMEHVLVIGGAGGGLDGCEEGLPDTFPLRAAASAPSTCLFQDLRADKIGSFEVGAYASGRLRTLDTPVRLANYGKLEELDLEIEAWADRRTDFDAVSIEGPANLVSPVPGARAGTNYALPRSLKIRVSCHRTAEAVANGNAVLSALRIRGGLLDEETVSFSLTGTACVAYHVDGTLPKEGGNAQTHRGFAWPRIVVEESFELLDPEVGPNTATPDGAFEFALRPGPVNAVAPSAEGVHDMALINSFRFADGQRARIRHLGGGAAGERIVRLPQFGAGAQLPEDRHLFQKGDYIDLRWNASVARWAESGYSTGQCLNLDGSTRLADAVDINSNAAVAINIPVPGATTADRVTNISWSAAATGPLQISPTISANGVVTVHLFNPGGTTTTIPKGAIVQAFIRKVFGAQPTPVPTLGALSLSSGAATAGQPWSVTISGETAGSVITASASDEAALNVSGNNLSGTFPSAGATTVTLTEALAGASNSPRSTSATVAVAAPARLLKPLMVSSTSGTADAPWMATISGQTGGSTIMASSSDGTVLTVLGDTVGGTFASAGAKTITLTETLADASNSPCTSTVNVSVAAPAPVLGALTLSSASATAGSAWSATIAGRIGGSTVAASSSDGAALVVSGNVVSGTFASAGPKTVTLSETLAGATESPRSSTAGVTVATAAPDLRPLTLNNTNAVASSTWTAAISGRTSGSSFSVTSSDGTPLAMSGINVSGTFPFGGGKTVTITETLAGASNSPRRSTIGVAVTTPAPVLGTLTLSSASSTAGAAWTAAIGGRTSGSTVTANSSDGAVLTVSSDEVSGTFASAGGKTVTLTETLTGATNSPRTSTVSLAVVAPVTPEDAESIALFAAMNTAPTSQRRARIDALIKRLKTANDGGATASIWAKLDVFFMFAAADEQAALLDWKNPGTRSAKKIGVPAFTPGEGFTGLNTSIDYLDPGYNPGGGSGAQSLGIAQDDAHASLYALTEGTTTASALSDGQRLSIRARNGARALIKLNSSGNTSLSDSVATPCSVTAVRTSAKEQLAYRNGSLIATGAVASTGVAGTITLLKSTDQQIASMSVGKALTAMQVEEYHAARLEYLRGIAADAAAALASPVTPPPPPPPPRPAPNPDTPASRLPEATTIPPTLIGPWEPDVKFAGKTVSLIGKAEDHLLLTKAQFSSPSALSGVKVQDCAMLRVEGVDMGGFELTQRARQHIACIGVMNDAAGKPESDGSNIAGVAGEQPDALYQYCRFVNFRGTDLERRTTTGVDNVTGLARLERVSSTRFRFTFKEPFPEGIAPGPVSPVRRITVANCTWNGSNLPLQGANWNYEIDKVIDPLTYEGVVQRLGGDRWQETPVPGVSEAGTGGQVWLYQLGKGEHSDSLFQIEDDKPVASLTLENCVTSGNYQVPGIIGTPGTPFVLRNVHAFKIFTDPQDPSTQNLYVKGTFPGRFEGCYFEMQFGRSLEYYSIYPRTPEVYTDKSGPRPRLTWRPGGRFTGEVIDGPPPMDYAPEAAIGVNWSGGNYAGYIAPTADSLRDITLQLDTLSASMAPGARIGVIDVAHSTKGEVIELEITGDTTNVAGVSAKSGTKLIRRGLVVGPSRLALGATYTVTITARLRRDPKISIQKTFWIAVS